MFCSGADAEKYEKKGNHEVGLAVRESIVAGMDKGNVAVECISARLMKVRIQLKGKSNGVFHCRLCSHSRQEHQRK